MRVRYVGLLIIAVLLIIGVRSCASGPTKTKLRPESVIATQNESVAAYNVNGSKADIVQKSISTPLAASDYDQALAMVESNKYTATNLNQNLIAIKLMKISGISNSSVSCGSSACKLSGVIDIKETPALSYHLDELAKEYSHETGLVKPVQRSNTIFELSGGSSVTINFSEVLTLAN